MVVKLEYFKRTGKWYASGEVEMANQPLFKIWDEVKAMRDEGCLPGLVKGHSDFIVSVDVPEHEHNHPHLIV